MLYFHAVKLSDELDRTEEIFSMDNYSACILHRNSLPSYRWSVRQSVILGINHGGVRDLLSGHYPWQYRYFKRQFRFGRKFKKWIKKFNSIIRAKILVKKAIKCFAINLQNQLQNISMALFTTMRALTILQKLLRRSLPFTLNKKRKSKFTQLVNLKFVH